MTGSIQLIFQVKFNFNFSSDLGYEYTSRQVEKLPQSDRPLNESVTPQTNIQASSYYLVSALRQTPVQDESDGRNSSRYKYTLADQRATEMS